MVEFGDPIGDLKVLLEEYLAVVETAHRDLGLAPLQAQAASVLYARTSGEMLVDEVQAFGAIKTKVVERAVADGCEEFEAELIWYQATDSEPEFWIEESRTKAIMDAMEAQFEPNVSGSPVDLETGLL